MIPLIKDKKVSEYTSAYSSTLWLFENVEKQEYLSHLEDIKAKGYKEAYKTDIEDNLTSVFENGENLIISSFYPCDNTVRTVLENNKKLVKNVISEETSKMVRYALESVVANGTGGNAYIENYRVGGKTGTAQIYENGKYLRKNA